MAFCTKMNIPVCNLLVTTLFAWLASTNIMICTSRPSGSGILGGSSSSMSPQNSVQSASPQKSFSLVSGVDGSDTIHFIGLFDKKCTIKYKRPQGDLLLGWLDIETC